MRQIEARLRALETATSGDDEYCRCPPDALHPPVIDYRQCIAPLCPPEMIGEFPDAPESPELCPRCGKRRDVIAIVPMDG